jgi:translation initiation factor 2B subunit (eIF-2B alpha/beta/delta family)
MTLEKEIRKYAKIEDFKNENFQELMTLLNNHMDKTKNFYKLDLDKVRPLRNSLNNFLNKINKIDLEITNTKEKDNKIIELEQKLEDKDELINKIITDKTNLKQDLKKIEDANIILTNNKVSISNDNEKLIQSIAKKDKMLLKANMKLKLLFKTLKDNNIKITKDKINEYRYKTSSKPKEKEQIDIDLNI